jgi:RNA polymerase sigma-70 factor (ECF subfamily)
MDAVTSGFWELTRLFEQHRQRMLGLAYRMLGNMTDAEDVVQEAYLRVRRAAQLPASPRAYLATIVTRLCLNHLSGARASRELYPGAWLPEPVPTEGAGGISSIESETLSLAFLTLLQTLQPLERAVFLLREVFEYEYEEIAVIVRKSPVNCRQIFRRSRQHLRAGSPRFIASPEQHAELNLRFHQAVASGDLSGLIQLLAEDVTLWSDGGGKRAATLEAVHGADRVSRLVVGAARKFTPDGFTLFLELNGRPAAVTYHGGEPFCAICLDCAPGAIRSVYVVTNPEKLRRLPPLHEGEWAAS